MRSGHAKEGHPGPARARRPRLWAWVGGLGLLVGSALPAQAQYALPPAPRCWPPPFCPAPTTGGPITPVPLSPGAPAPAAPRPTPPGAETSAPPSAGAPPSVENAPQAPEEAPPAPTGGESSLALGGATFATGYIDQAIPLTQFRLRFDAAYDDNRPDRAEFFYAKCGCNPGGRGPARPETRVDYQDVSSYLEVAATDRFSAFVEVPVRFLNPEVNENTAGLADMNAGFKYALVACQERYLTFQFRTYIPTGAETHGLGTGHVSLEPGLLFHQQLADRLFLDTELEDWVPVGGTDFAGNVLIYGVGLSYLALNRPNFRILPVAEFVGWTVLSGKESAVASVTAAASPMVPGNVAVQDSGGETIVNAKLGVRFGFGSPQAEGYLSHSDLYVGYGRALTGDFWYKDFLRIEYRLLF